MVANDPIVEVQINVAEMKGMLVQALSDQGQRILTNENNISGLNTRHGELSQTVSAHDVKINNVERDVIDIREKQNNFWSKLWPVLALMVSAAGFLWAIIGGR